jgi:uncharacterized protein
MTVFASTEPATIIAQTEAWLVRLVIGLNLCPFAKAVHGQGRIRYVVCMATDEAGLLVTLLDELDHLVRADPAQVDTTLLIHPWVLTDFADYNQFLGVADDALVRSGHDGVIQIASFHPHYRFTGTARNDVGNASNRSPYPMLHLLREASVERAVAAFPDAARIYERNVETLRMVGRPGLERLMSECRGDAPPTSPLPPESRPERSGGPRR